MVTSTLPGFYTVTVHPENEALGGCLQLRLPTRKKLSKIHATTYKSTEFCSFQGFCYVLFSFISVSLDDLTTRKTVLLVGNAFGHDASKLVMTM